MTDSLSLTFLIATIASTTAFYVCTIYEVVKRKLAARVRDAVATPAGKEGIAMIDQDDTTPSWPAAPTQVQLMFDEIMARLTAIEEKIDDLIARGIL